MIKDKIITDDEIRLNNVKSSADDLKGSAQDNKNVFDKLPELIALKHNSLIDELTKNNTNPVKSTDIAFLRIGSDTDMEISLDGVNWKKPLEHSLYAKSDKNNTYTKNETDTQINNKVLEISSADMTKAVYDKNNNGTVDSAEKLAKFVNIGNALFDGSVGITLEQMGAAEAKQLKAIEQLAGQAMPKNGGAFTGEVVFSNGVGSSQILTIKKLWENASPTSAFAPQTINLDLTLYDGIIVTQYPHVSMTEWSGTSATVFKSGRKCGLLIVYSATGGLAGSRKVEIVDNGVNVKSAYGKTDNAFIDGVIPHIIYGFKGVQNV